MQKAILILLTLMMTAAFGATWATSADAYEYITAEDLNTRLGKGSPMILVDIFARLNNSPKDTSRAR